MKLSSIHTVFSKEKKSNEELTKIWRQNLAHISDKILFYFAEKYIFKILHTHPEHIENIKIMSVWP